MFWGDLEGAADSAPPRSQATSRRPALLGLSVGSVGAGGCSKRDQEDGYQSLLCFQSVSQEN